MARDLHDDSAEAVLADIFGRKVPADEWARLRSALATVLRAEFGAAPPSWVIDAVFSDLVHEQNLERVLKRVPLDEHADETVHGWFTPYLAPRQWVGYAIDGAGHSRHRLKLTRTALSIGHAEYKMNLYLEQLNSATDTGCRWELDTRPDPQLPEEDEGSLFS